MAGTNANTVTYVFEGNAQPIQKVINSLRTDISNALKDVKQFDDKTQEALKNTAKVARSTLRTVQARINAGGKVTKAEVKSLNEQLEAAEKLVKQLNREKGWALGRQAKAGQAVANRIENAQLNTGAGQFSLYQKASYLNQQVTQNPLITVDPAVSGEIEKETNLYIQLYNAKKQGAAVDAQLVAVGKRLLKNYRTYNNVIHQSIQEQRNAKKEVVSLGNFLQQLDAYIVTSIKSFTFWLNALRKFYGYLKNGIKIYADYVEAVNFFNVALGDATNTMEDYIRTMRLAYSANPTELYTTAAAFLSIANAMRFSSEQAVDFSREMTQLAADFASLHNLSLAEALSAIRSGLAGNVRALQKYGINVAEATMNEWLLTKGINQTMNSLSEATQYYLRAAYVAESMSEAQGDLANTFKSPANQIRALGNQLSLLAQNIGALLTPVIMIFTRTLVTAFTAINAFFSSLTQHQDSMFSTASAIDSESDALDDLSDSADNASSHLTGLDEINQANNDKKTFGLDEGIIEKITLQWEEMGGNIWWVTDLLSGLGTILSPIFDIISSIFKAIDIENIFQGVQSFFDWLKGQTWLQTFFGWIGSFFNEVASFFNYIFNNVPVLSNILRTMITGVALLIGGTLLPKMAAWTAAHLSNTVAILAGVKASLLGKTATTAQAAATIKDTVATKANTAAEATNTTTKKLSVAATVKQTWSEFTLATAKLKEAIASKKSSAASVLEMSRRSAETTTNISAAASNWALAAAKVAAMGVAALAGAALIAAAVGSIAMIASGNSINNYMATGGVVTSPTTAVIGEGAYDEAVIPLGHSPQFTSMKEDIATAVVTALSTAGILGVSSDRNSPSSNQPIVLQIDGRELARALWPKLSATYHQVGVKLK